MPSLPGDLARWVAVLKSSDVKEVLSRMSSYYVNLSLLAALLGGFGVPSSPVLAYQLAATSTIASKSLVSPALSRHVPSCRALSTAC